MAQAGGGGRRAHWTNSGPVADGPAAGTNDWRDWGTNGLRARTDVWHERTDVWRVSIRADGPTGRLRPSRLTTNAWHGGIDVERGNSRLWLFNERCVCVCVSVCVYVCM